MTIRMILLAHEIEVVHGGAIWLINVVVCTRNSLLSIELAILLVCLNRLEGYVHELAVDHYLLLITTRILNIRLLLITARILNIRLLLITAITLQVWSRLEWLRILRVCKHVRVQILWSFLTWIESTIWTSEYSHKRPILLRGSIVNTRSVASALMGSVLSRMRLRSTGHQLVYIGILDWAARILIE